MGPELKLGTPTWFGPSGRPLHGWVHLPEDARARGVAVFCNPLGRESANALPAVGAAVVLFVLAALVEGYISASSLPYSAKAAVAILSATVIVAYLALGGRGVDGLEGRGHP